MSGFKPNFSAIDDIDAENFLKAMDAGLVSPVERRRRAPLYEAPQSRAGEQLFWEHDKNAIPRPLTLWIEPIITIATLSTLHFDFGWPRELLGTQSVDWAFDVAAYVASDLENEYIACEVKKTVEEVDRLVESMRKFGALSADDAYEAKKTDAKLKNAYRKVKALRARRAPFFWAIGPGGYGFAFALTYADDGIIDFEEVRLNALGYPAAAFTPA